MDHIKILKRAFHITVNYRALWVFGILLALTTLRRGGDGGGGGGGSSGGGGSALPSFHLASPQFPEISAQAANTFLGVALLLACLAILIIVAGAILRYVSETALIRMVDLYEASGEKMGVRQGFRLGWSRPAWRIFLIDLVFGLAGLAIFLLLLLIAAAPLLVWLTESEPLRAIGTVAAGSLGMIVIFLAILAAIVVSLLLQFIRRACVLEGLGVIESIRQGYVVFRKRLGDGIVMGILLFAAGLLFVIVLIPLAILLILAGIVLGGLPGLLVGWIASLVAEGSAPWIAGAIIAVPVFLLVVVAPLAFLGGLFEVFKSSAWTLTYREMMALEAVQA
jgi:hypothetical protein